MEAHAKIAAVTGWVLYLVGVVSVLPRAGAEAQPNAQE
jgi:hypothetical protein